MSGVGKNSTRWMILALVLLLLTVMLVACGADQPPSTTSSPLASQPDPLATAAAQATAIIQQAQATALVVEAEARAKEMLADAALVKEDPEELEEEQEIQQEQDSYQTAAEQEDAITATRPAPEVEIIGVGYAAEGGFIIVSYKAPPDIADTFWPGLLSVTDEGSGTIYNEVPVMPKIGPMISRPATDGQVGYVMFVNPPPGLPPGSLVTVTFGSYIFQHLEVQ